MDDIVPGLLESIQSQFDEKTYNSAKLKKALKLLQDKKATYVDVNDFAIEVGEILADVLGTNITAEILPDGKMYFNIAERILNPTMRKNFDLVDGFASDVQWGPAQEKSWTSLPRRASHHQSSKRWLY